VKHSRTYLTTRAAVRALFWTAVSVSIFALTWLTASIYADAIGWHSH
jgi:hypothetical protein